MTLKVTHPALRKILDSQAPFLGKHLHLFQNNWTFDRNTVLTDLVECDFDGYASQDPVWTASFQNGVEDVATSPSLTFTAGAGLAGPQTVYGYYFLDEDGDLSWGETFAGGPVTIAVIGQTLVVYPQLKAKNYGET